MRCCLVDNRFRLARESKEMDMQGRRMTASMLLLLGLAGCGSLQERNAVANSYMLDATFVVPVAHTSRTAAVLVAAPREAAGFASARMGYVRTPHKLEYFARNKWVDAPGKMLTPLLVKALEAEGGFATVIQGPSRLRGDVRLETEVVRLQQEFLTTPSRVHFTLRAQLVDVSAGKVLATREFDTSEAATSEDPYGGVMAANRAVKRVLSDVARFCAEHIPPGK